MIPPTTPITIPAMAPPDNDFDGVGSPGADEPDDAGDDGVEVVVVEPFALVDELQKG